VTLNVHQQSRLKEKEKILSAAQRALKLQETESATAKAK